MRNFKFFVGFTNSTMTVNWGEDEINDMLTYQDVDAERQLTNLLSEEIAMSIDENIIRRLTRDINGGLRA